MKIKALIEKTDNGYYSITSDEQIGNYCLGGYGDSLADAKADFMSVVKEAQAFCDYFDWINITKFAQVAGVNESKLRLYKVGKAFAGERTRAKLQAAVKRMGAELAAVNI